MIEPLRFNQEKCPAYEIPRPVFCQGCLMQKHTKHNPSIAIKFCHNCPTSLGADKTYGAFLCKICDENNHKLSGSRSHVRQIVVVGPGIRKKVITRGDGKNFPFPLDNVKIRLKSKIYSNGKRVHRVPTKDLSFVSGMSGKCLHVQVLGAKNLKQADLFGSSDPFVVYSFCGKPLGATRIRPCTLNPRWDNETFIVPMDENMPMPRNAPQSQAEIVRFEVYDHDWVTQNDFLGHLEITRSKLMKIALIANNQPIRLPLTNQLYHGIVDVQLGHCTNNLYVKVVKAENLDKLDVITLSNPYAKVYMGNGTLIGTTAVIDHTINPHWEGTGGLTTNSNIFKVRIMQALFAERYALAQIDAYKETQLQMNRAGSSGHPRRNINQNHLSMYFDEFDQLPNNLALFRIELYDYRSMQSTHRHLGNAYISVHKLRKLLPSFPRADVAGLPGYAEYVTRIAQSEQRALQWKEQLSWWRRHMNKFISITGSALRHASNFSHNTGAIFRNIAYYRVQYLQWLKNYNNKSNKTVRNSNEDVEEEEALLSDNDNNPSSSFSATKEQTASYKLLLQQDDDLYDHGYDGNAATTATWYHRRGNLLGAVPSAQNMVSLHTIGNNGSAFVSNNSNGAASLFDTILGINSPPGNSNNNATSQAAMIPVKEEQEDTNMMILEERDNNNNNDEVEEKKKRAMMLQQSGSGIHNSNSSREEGSPAIISPDCSGGKSHDIDDDDDIEHQRTSAALMLTIPVIDRKVHASTDPSAIIAAAASPNANLLTDRRLSLGTPFFATSPMALAVVQGARRLSLSMLGSPNISRATTPLLSPTTNETVIVWASSHPFPVTIVDKGDDEGSNSRLDENSYIVLRLIPASRGAVLLGIDEAVRQMTIGETAVVKCRYDYAYNSYSMGSNIPPRSNVVFTVKLLELNGHGKFSMPARQFLRFYRLLKRIWFAFYKYVLLYIYTMIMRCITTKKVQSEAPVTKKSKKKKRKHRRKGFDQTEEEDIIAGGNRGRQTTTIKKKGGTTTATLLGRSRTMLQYVGLIRKIAADELNDDDDDSSSGSSSSDSDDDGAEYERRNLINIVGNSEDEEGFGAYNYDDDDEEEELEKSDQNINNNNNPNGESYSTTLYQQQKSKENRKKMIKPDPNIRHHLTPSVHSGAHLMWSPNTKPTVAAPPLPPGKIKTSAANYYINKASRLAQGPVVAKKSAQQLQKESADRLKAEIMKVSQQALKAVPKQQVQVKKTTTTAATSSVTAVQNNRKFSQPYSASNSSNHHDNTISNNNSSNSKNNIGIAENHSNSRSIYSTEEEDGNKEDRESEGEEEDEDDGDYDDDGDRSEEVGDDDDEDDYYSEN